MNIEKTIISAVIALGLAASAALASGGHQHAHGDLPSRYAPADPSDGVAGQHAPVPVEDPLARLLDA
jgi:hypothetical protein